MADYQFETCQIQYHACMDSLDSEGRSIVGTEVKDVAPTKEDAENLLREHGATEHPVHGLVFNKCAFTPARVRRVQQFDQSKWQHTDREQI